MSNVLPVCARATGPATAKHKPNRNTIDRRTRTSFGANHGLCEYSMAEAYHTLTNELKKIQCVARKLDPERFGCLACKYLVCRRFPDSRSKIVHRHHASMERRDCLHVEMQSLDV